MKKAILPVAFLSVVALSAKAGPLSMSRPFTTASLRALREIAVFDGDTDELEKPTRVGKLLNEASDEARSSGELSAVKILSRFFKDKASNNALRRLVQYHAWRQFQDSHAASESYMAEKEPEVKREALEVPFVEAMTEREESCQLAIDQMLRKETFSKPAVCSRVFDEKINAAGHGTYW